jgi:DNA polymerase-3 subunit gamma/tau
MATHSLFKEHGRLVSFTGSVADISIVNEHLLKAARSRINHIEEAFTKVCRQPVKVNLYIASTTPQTKIETPLQPPIPEKLPEPVSPAALSPNQTPTVLPQPKIEKPPAIAVAQPPPPQPDDSSNTEVKLAAQSLAKFFEGEIVAIALASIEDGEMEGEDTGTTVQPRVSGRPDLSNIADDEDIPFRWSKQNKILGYGSLDDPWERQPNPYRGLHWMWTLSQ